MRTFSIFILTLVFSTVSLLADTVTVKKTKQVFENVKTSKDQTGNLIVESKDGTKQTFKENQVQIVSAPVVWEEPKPEAKPGFFQRLFGKSSQTNQSTEGGQTQANVDGKTNTEEPPKSALERRFPEIAMGGMVLLYFLLP
ncbi:hypothetical protein LPTSP4_05190 [Leptospira ryugenii]|uniref:Uncharacterized protein n=1 Tax=Leptospira ryugenii TaxID=1917863 RepID=A0A2P2DWL7_9LEPT|nr:hypothetical protein [Leptospira ryugenii]GBF49012.1 hypothetical protein LPTSP4_05190 [Leptospira ryugenii]